MANFLFVYYGGMRAVTPVEQKKTMDVWMGWFGKLGKSAVDSGAPTKSGKLVNKSGTRNISVNPIAGSSIIKADNLDAAVVLAKEHPNIPDGIQIAIYELLPM